jgi:hypothetical protein
MLILPLLSYAGTDNGKGNGGQNPGKQNGKDPSVPSFQRQTQFGCCPLFRCGFALFLATSFSRRGALVDSSQSNPHLADFARSNSHPAKAVKLLRNILCKV